MRRMVSGVDLANGVVRMAFTTFGDGMRVLSRDSLRQVVNFRRPDAIERRFWRRRMPASLGSVAYRLEALQSSGTAGRGAWSALRGKVMGRRPDGLTWPNRMRATASPPRWPGYQA